MPSISLFRHIYVYIVIYMKEKQQISTFKNEKIFWYFAWKMTKINIFY